MSAAVGLLINIEVPTSSYRPSIIYPIGIGSFISTRSCTA
jgi:hypothetical protein